MLSINVCEIVLLSVIQPDDIFIVFCLQDAVL